MRAANDNRPRMAFRGSWVGEEFCPDTKFHKLDKDEVEAKRKAEKQAMHRERARLATRMKIGKDWDGAPANDNIAWPLAKALLAEGNGDLLKYALAYRKVHTQACSNAVLGGSTYTEKDGRVLDYVSNLDESTGVISYGKPRKSRSVEAVASTPPRRKNATNEASTSAFSSVPKPWNGDKSVNDMIDARPKLSRLRLVLGAIVEPFEMAVVDGATLAEVGKASGASSRDGAPAAGRAICHMGLLAIRGVLGELRMSDIAA